MGAMVEFDAVIGAVPPLDSLLRRLWNVRGHEVAGAVRPAEDRRVVPVPHSRLIDTAASMAASDRGA